MGSCTSRWFRCAQLSLFLQGQSELTSARFLSQLNVLGRTDLGNLVSTLAPFEVVLDRLYDINRHSLGLQGPMPNIETLDRSGGTVSPGLFTLQRSAATVEQRPDPFSSGPVMSLTQHKLLSMLSSFHTPLQRMIVSPAYDHAVNVARLRLHVETLVDQARPNRDLGNALPDEILLRIGHLVLEQTVSGPTTARRDQDRISLGAVCQRWSKIFALAEFWADVDVGMEVFTGRGLPAETRKVRGVKARRQLEAFLAKGGLVSVYMTRLGSDEEISPALAAMRGRLATVQSWTVNLPRSVSFDRIWQVWTGADDFKLERWSVTANADMTLPPPTIDLSSLTKLRVDQCAIDLVSFLPLLPNLTSLELAGCILNRDKATLEDPVTVRLPKLSKVNVSLLRDVFYQAGSVFFDLPKLAELSVQSDEVMAALLPPAPHPVHERLQRLSVYQPRRAQTSLVPTLLRHSSIGDLRLTVGEALARATVDALGQGACPKLEVLHVHINQFDQPTTPTFGSSLLAAIRLREDAAKRGEDVTPLRELHTDQGGRSSLGSLSMEEQDGLWAHLRVLTGFGTRPK